MHWHIFLAWLRRKHILTAQRREKAKLTTPTRRGVGNQVKSSEEILVRSPCEKALSTKNCGIRTTFDVPSLHDPRRGCRGHQDRGDIFMSPCSCCDIVSSFGGNNVSECTKDNTTICAITGKKEIWKPNRSVRQSTTKSDDHGAGARRFPTRYSHSQLADCTTSSSRGSSCCDIGLHFPFVLSTVFLLPCVGYNRQMISDSPYPSPTRISVSQPSSTTGLTLPTGQLPPRQPRSWMPASLSL